MPDTLAIRGAAAVLKWGYTTAASLGAWSVAGTPGSWTFTATVISKDDFRLSQRPLEVVTPNGWHWTILTLQIAGPTLTASIAPSEVPHAVVVHST